MLWSCRQGRKTIPPVRIPHSSPLLFHGDRFPPSAALSQQLSIRSLSWVITRMVLPCRASLFNFSAIRRMFHPSSPLAGLSRIRILRPEKEMAQAMASRCFCPPQNHILKIQYNIFNNLVSKSKSTTLYG